MPDYNDALMPSLLIAKVKLRLLDRARESMRFPNRIDTAAEISPLARVRSSAIHGPVTVGDYARIYRVTISGPVSIGMNSSLWGPNVYVAARGNPVSIGNFCSIARDVSLHGFGHDPSRISTSFIGRNIFDRPIQDDTV